MNKFIFDVDGTLTPSRSKIDPAFKQYFNEFCQTNDVYLVTGSDRPKTLEQIGEDTYNLCKRVYNCSGNDVWEKSVNVHRNHWKLPEDAHEWLSEKLTNSAFPLRTGLHFEHRTGLCNFSIVGRNANLKERAEYIAWDNNHDERELISYNFNITFPHLEARPGGETGIDISMKGFDKSQIIKDFSIEYTLYFFGDRCDTKGNDYPIARAVDHYRNVINWKQTMEYLQIFQEQGIAA